MHNASLYECANWLQRRDIEAVLGEFAVELNWRDRELILDVGCGAGDVTVALLKPTAVAGASETSTGPNSGGRGRSHPQVDIVGVDVSEEMVSHAKKRFSSRHLSFSRMDISKAIPAHKVTRTFSKVFSFYCLHWVKDQATALSNIHRLLEADGEILLVFLARNPLFSAYRRLAEKDAWKGYMQDVNSFIPVQQDMTDPAANFSQMLDSVGFQVICCEARQMSYTFDNANHLAAALAAVNPFLPRMKCQAMRSKYMAELMQQLGELGAELGVGGGATARYTLLVVHAKKPLVRAHNVFGD